MNRSFLRKSLVVAGCAVIALVLNAGLGLAATVGQELANPQLRDANDNPATIPDFGTHVITVTYADSSAGDYGDPMNDATKAKKLQQGGLPWNRRRQHEGFRRAQFFDSKNREGQN